MIEIKNSNRVRLIKESEYRRGVYGLSYQVTDPIAQLNHAINRIAKLSKIEKNKIAKEFNLEVENINFNSPRGLLVVGRNYEMNNHQRESFYLNVRENTKISQVFTYDDIISMLENAIKTFKNSNPNATNTM